MKTLDCFRASTPLFLLAATAFGQTGDTIAPALRAFSFSPTSVNTASAAVTLTANFSVTDDVSGIDQVSVTWFNPARSVWYGNTAVVGGRLQWAGMIGVTLPQFSQGGTWTPELILTDKAGNVRRMMTSDITALGFPTALIVTGQTADTTAPALSAFSFSPTSVNTASAAATVTSSFSVADNLSGVDQVAVTWFNSTRSVWFGNTAVVGGQTQWSGTIGVTLPQFSQGGTWTPELILTDKPGNVRRMMTADITALGFPTALTVAASGSSGQGDTTAPRLVTFSINPTTVDVSSGPATVSVHIVAIDDLSGFGSGSTGNGSLDIRHTSGSNPFGRGSLPTTGGTLLNPTFDFTLTVPQFSLSGSYPINLTLIDNAFNTARYTPAELQRLGFPSAVTVTSMADTKPPQLVSFSIRPTTVDVSSGPATLSVHIVAIDDLSGFGGGSTGNGSIDIRHTSGSNPLGRGSLPTTGGTRLNPTFDFTLTVPQFSPSGSYPINLTLIDNVFNTARYTPADLQRLGFPSAITVAILPSIQLGNTALTFNYQSGGDLPRPQSLTLSSSAALSFTAISSGESWLSVNPPSGTTPATVSVSVNPGGLSPGAYNGTIIITAPGAGNSPRTASINLVVTDMATIALSSTVLNFSYQSGGILPQAQSVTISESPATAFTASVSGGNWLSVSPTSGTTTATLIVSVSPAGLVPGSYLGTVMITASGASNGPQRISVTLTVAAAPPPVPAVTAIVNAASFEKGVISPGEIVSIGGTAIGPSVPAGSELDQYGSVSTSLGGVQVLFNGTLAPLIYVSSAQINAVVPYEIVGTSNAIVQVKFMGQTSNAFSVTTAPSAPALFTASGSGTGAGAFLNQDGSYNGPTNPAPKGSYVVLYLTGEGQTAPAGVTGKVTVPSAVPPLTPKPVLPVSVFVDGQQVDVAFYGEAPGMVSGVIQLNVQVPVDARSGDLPIKISVGGSSTLSGVTVSVQ